MDDFYRFQKSATPQDDAFFILRKDGINGQLPCRQPQRET